MKRIKKTIIFVIVSLFVLVLTVLFPVVWLGSRVLKIPYLILRGSEIFTVIFWKAVREGYRVSAKRRQIIASLTKTIGQVGRQESGRPS